MARFRHHKYTWSKPFTSTRHDWQFVGPDGAVNFHANITPGYDVSAGLEFHWVANSRPQYRCDDAPDHLNCPLTGGACWHDGTSLYASEHLWPMIAAYLRSGEHEMVFRLLEGEYDEKFGKRTRDEDEAA